jgi:hypothetical protein
MTSVQLEDNVIKCYNGRTYPNHAHANNGYLSPTIIKNEQVTMVPKKHSYHINKIDHFSDLQEEVRQFLLEVTGERYSFATNVSRIWGRKVKKFGKNEDEILELEDEDSAVSRVEHGTFFQLMPDRTDDGFFNWYCRERMYNQYFTTKEMCVAYFLKFWIIWKSVGEPGKKAPN